MKRRLLIIIGIFTLLAMVGGAALLISINRISSNLDEMIVLHQVEIQRDHLLLNIHDVKVSLFAHDPKHDDRMSAIRDLMQRTKASIAACFGCHHTAGVAARLSDLRRQIGRFDEHVEKVLAVRADARSMLAAREQARIIGDSLTDTINAMIILTSRNLAERTLLSRRSQQRSELIVYLLVVAGPVMVAVFGFAALRGFAGPIQTLLAVARRMHGGDLSVRVEGLRHEFAELAAGFNDMAAVLEGRLTEISDRERRYRFLFESAADAIFILDAEGEGAGNIVSANQSAAAMHSYTVEELTSMNIRDIDTPESASRINERMERLLRGERLKAELTHVKKDGTVFPVEISAALFEFGGHKYILAIDRDLTERRRAEEALMKAEHLRTTGELAAGLAHEIKNPLAGMKVTMETLAAESALAEEDRRILFRVVDEIDRIDGLIKGLLNFARPPRPHYMSTDVNAVLEGAVQLVTRQGARTGSGGAVEVVKEYDPDLPDVVADPLQLRQVFMNLLINAFDALPGGGSVVLKTACPGPAGAVTVSVADTGKGMDAVERDNVFQPFFTTKAGGTGLGLAISKRLIEEQGGEISVRSSPGAGTTFTVTIPREQRKGTNA